MGKVNSNTILYDFQVEAVEFINTHRYCLVGYEQGLGKTLIALARSVEHKKTLIVAPAFLKRTWENEADKFLIDTTIQIISKESDLETPADIYIISYGIIQKLQRGLIKQKFDMIVCDEFHYIKNIYAKRTIALHNIVRQIKPAEFVGLSGTPIKNRVTEFFSPLALCASVPLPTNGLNTLKYFPRFSLFADHFSHRRETNYGVTYEGVKNISDLKKLLKYKYTRKRVDEVLNLPSLNYIETVIPDEINEDALWEAWQVYDEKGEKTSFTSQKVVSALAKAKFTVDYVNNLLTSGGVDQLVIYSDHISPAHAIASNIAGSLLITGQTPVDKRAEYVEQFQEGTIKVLVATIGSLKEGVTLTATQHLIFNDLSWIPADNSQVERRIYRIGQKKRCFIHTVLSGKMDGVIVGTLRKKQKILEKTIGGKMNE